MNFYKKNNINKYISIDLSRDLYSICLNNNKNKKLIFSYKFIKGNIFVVCSDKFGKKKNVSWSFEKSIFFNKFLQNLGFVPFYVNKKDWKKI